MSACPFSSLVLSLYGLSSWEIRTCRMEGLWSLVCLRGWFAMAMWLHTPRRCHRLSEARPAGVSPPLKPYGEWWEPILPYCFCAPVGRGCVKILLTNPECTVRQSGSLSANCRGGELPQPCRGPSGWLRRQRVWERKADTQTWCSNISRLPIPTRSGYRERQERSQWSSVKSF